MWWCWGGYAATLKADFVQGLVMLVGVTVLIIAVVRCDQVGGLQAGMAAMAAETEKLNLGPLDHAGLWATVLMTSFGTWGLPQMIHKYYGIRDDREVKRGTVISTLFALVVAGGGYFIGSLSHLFFTELPSPPGGGAGNPDYLVPNMLVQAHLPNVLLGIVLVLLIAASVSTLASITITASSTLTMDWVQARLKPSLTSAATARLTKGVCAVFILLSYVIANTQTPILDMMSYSWGILSGSFLAPYAIALYWKGINRTGAGRDAGRLYHSASAGGMQAGFSQRAALPGWGKLRTAGPHFACLAMAVSFLLCLAVSAGQKGGRPGRGGKPGLL